MNSLSSTRRGRTVRQLFQEQARQALGRYGRTIQAALLNKSIIVQVQVSMIYYINTSNRDHSSLGERY